MTKRDLFRVLIKIIALYYLIGLPSYILTSFSSFFGFGGFYSSGFETLYYSAFALLSCVVVLAVLCFLVFCGDWIIDLFKLDKQFDNDLINFSKVTSLKLLNLGIILIGGFSIVIALPDFIYSGFNLLREIISSDMYISQQDYTEYFVKDLIQMVLGILLLSNYRRISRYILRQNESNEVVEE